MSYHSVACLTSKHQLGALRSGQNTWHKLTTVMQYLHKVCGWGGHIMASCMASHWSDVSSFFLSVSPASLWVRLNSINVFLTIFLIGAGLPAAFTRAISTADSQGGTSKGLVNTKALSPRRAACFSFNEAPPEQQSLIPLQASHRIITKHNQISVLVTATVRMTIQAGWLHRPFASDVEGRSCGYLYPGICMNPRHTCQREKVPTPWSSYCLQRYWQMVCRASQHGLSCVQSLIKGAYMSQGMAKPHHATAAWQGSVHDTAQHIKYDESCTLVTR